MMKKNGFTLAEVLITLAIIGVVATLTLPALMTNTAEQQAKTALKKGINTLTEAAQTNQAIAGFDYASFKDTATGSETNQSLYALLANRTNVDYRKTNSASTRSIVDGNAKAGGTNYVVFFRDGSALSFNPSKTKYDQNQTSGKKVSEKESDGLSYGIAAIYDTNGEKGPNILSNCTGEPTRLAENSAAWNKDNEGDCNDKAKRVIKDQFGVRLREGYAVPNGAAARWAFDN